MAEKETETKKTRKPAEKTVAAKSPASEKTVLAKAPKAEKTVLAKAPKSEKTVAAKAPEAEKPVKVKKEKKQKVVAAKKLPKILKKSYTKEALEKKLLKKIYIETDRKLIEGLFAPAKDKKGREVMKVDLTKTLPKEQFERCKAVAKDVAAQKGAVKLVPLLAVVCLLVAIGVVVTLFKNVVVKKGIQTAMENIFQAKTDVARVDLQIFGASLEVDGLAQADKDSPMKNIFEIDRIMVDFNLTDLLRGKFHATDVEVTGVSIGTERKTSGALLVQPALSAAVEQTTAAIAETSQEQASSASDKLKEMFADYNPETMLANIQNELKSPAVATKISGEVQKKVEKWQNVPGEYQSSITKLSDSVNSFVKTDWGNIYEVSKLQGALSDLNTIYTESQSLQKKLNTTANDIKTDSNYVNSCSKELQTAIKADTALVDTKINAMKQTFSAAGLKSIMNDAVQSMLYKLAGKYYPYVNKAMNAALSAKGSSSKTDTSASEKSSKEKKKTKTAGHARSAGRTVYYKKDTVPKLLIEKVKASGYEYNTKNLLFQGTASEISSDQNMRGKPATINADFKVLGKKNTANVVVDARDSSNAKLVTADYSGYGYPVSADASVFTVDSNSDISAKMTADSDGTFVIGGTLNMHVTGMKGMEFEPAKVSELYGKALSNIQLLTIGFNIGYDGENGVVVEITNAEKLAGQLVTPVTKALTAELTTIANDAKKNVTKTLSEKTGIATDQIDKFTDISSAINGDITTVKGLQKQLDAKKAEIEKQIKNQAADAAADAAKSLLNKLF